MNKGLLYMGVAFFFASYHAFIDKSTSAGMYTTIITNENIGNVIGIVTFLLGLICIIVAILGRNKKHKDYNDPKI